MESVRLYLDRLPRKKIDKSFYRQVEPNQTIVIYDRRLPEHVPGFSQWLLQFPYVFAVRSGESLKSVEAFNGFLSKVHRKVGGHANPSWTVLAIGGGSVGDFAGFFASVYKRGLKLVHLPTTWLAALDSSHGGKTGLNFQGAKNQIGTFYPADATVMVRSVLMALPQKHLLDALGELLKIAIIDGSPWVKKMRLDRGSASALAREVWKFLKPAVEAKLKVVRRDPLEKTGERHRLNLGHTFGHVIEGATGTSHGISVWLGLQFAIELSLEEGILNPKRGAELLTWLAKQSAMGLVQRPRLKRQTARRLIKTDKKRTGSDKVRFVFVKGLGQTEVREISIERLLLAAKENGWFR
ncbi:MAG: 3-dehydroquinate synthase [Deltaproteobacteria bacterium]|nr:3-dehydroquinate synthase [Deltaproteobacteria bacterium]